MVLLDNIRLYVHRRSLQQLLAASVRQRGQRSVSLESAKQVGIYFNGTEVDDQRKVETFAQELRQKGKQVHILAYLDLDVAGSDFPFPAFTRKQVDWAYRPKAEALEHFLSQSFDLFFCLNTQSDILSDYVASLSRAALKLGPVSERTSAYDIMIDAKPGADLSRLMQQMLSLLQKTNVQYQPA